MKAIQIEKFGGPEVLQYVEVAEPVPAATEVLIEIRAAGVNFADIYSRHGTYPGPPFPRVLGMEGAGYVRAVGGEVKGFREGDLVAFSNAPGAYAEFASIPSTRVVGLPEGLEPEEGAAALLQGMTAHYLSHSTYPVRRGDVVLVHAGSGGVGLLLTQMVKRLGGVVVSTVSSDEKAALSREAGADYVIRYDDFADEIQKLTDGEGVHVAYDGVGATTFEKSLASLRPRGYMVLYGAASGPVPPVDPALLNTKSLFLTRPGLVDHIASREEFEQRAQTVLRWVRSGELRIRVEQVFPLAHARQAQEALASRKTTGKLLLIP